LAKKFGLVTNNTADLINIDRKNLSTPANQGLITAKLFDSLFKNPYNNIDAFVLDLMRIKKL